MIEEVFYKKLYKELFNVTTFLYISFFEAKYFVPERYCGFNLTENMFSARSVNILFSIEKYTIHEPLDMGA